MLEIEHTLFVLRGFLESYANSASHGKTLGVDRPVPIVLGTVSIQADVAPTELYHAPHNVIPS